MTTQAPERGLTLYELTGEYANIKALLDAEARADELDPTEDYVAPGGLQEALDRLGTAIEAKAEGILMVYKQQCYEADSLDNEAQRLRNMAESVAKRADAKRNGAERLKTYMGEQLATLGDDTQRFETTRVRATLPKRPADVVVVTDPDRVGVGFRRSVLKMPASEVPAELAKYVTGVDIDKSAINDTFKRTGVVPAGCDTAPGKRSLRIV